MAPNSLLTLFSPILLSQCKGDNKSDAPLGSEEVSHLDAEAEEMMDATWSEVLTSCCHRTPKDWGLALVGTCAALFFLFFFLVGTLLTVLL